MNPQPRLAIACQGGGSHCAFTAGALSAWLTDRRTLQFEIVGLSGASGGGLCALLAWYGLLRHLAGSSEPLDQPLREFWHDNTAQSFAEQTINNAAIQYRRLEDSGLFPSFPASPLLAEFLQQTLTTIASRPAFFDLRRLLNQHLPFDRFPALNSTGRPVLQLSAVNVRSGDCRIFDSARDPITSETAMATAALPYLFQPVEIDGEAYWDGLFAANPPITSLVEATRPDHLWIIQVTPAEKPFIPVTEEAIIDRTNELAGNLNLNDAVASVRQFNRWIEQGAFTPDFIQRNQMKSINLRILSMNSDLAAELDYASKLDRNPRLMHRLFAEGERQALDFLETLA